MTAISASHLLTRQFMFPAAQCLSNTARGEALNADNMI
jgi:hypothetical protein